MSTVLEFLDKDDSLIVETLKQRDPAVPLEIADVANCKYINCKRRGFSLCCEKKEDNNNNYICVSIHLYADLVDGYSQYREGEMPQGITFKMTNIDAIKKFGEPTSKGGGKINMWMEYRSLGVQLEFLGRSFEDISNRIGSVVLFTPLCENKLCPSLRPSLLCSRCRVVFYCAADCQRLHWEDSHKKTCRSPEDREKWRIF